MALLVCALIPVMLNELLVSQGQVGPPAMQFDSRKQAMLYLLLVVRSVISTTSRKLQSVYEGASEQPYPHRYNRTPLIPVI